MREAGLPELACSNLEAICLDVKAQYLKMPMAELLAGATKPRQPEAVAAALICL
jgi:L-alanine-DL-glutamate epimerase-like enolase superfamily enzyme